MNLGFEHETYKTKLMGSLICREPPGENDPIIVLMRKYSLKNKSAGNKHERMGIRLLNRRYGC